MNNNTATTKLYALLLRLRPLERGTLMPFSGELVHGAWLHWLKQTAPDLSYRLHEGNQRRLFTCSSLQFPVTRERTFHAQRENIHLSVEPQKSYLVRLTFLLGDLYPLLYNTILNNPLAQNPQPFMRIGKQFFALEGVVSDPSDPSGWTGGTSCEALVEQVRPLRLASVHPLELEFASLTTFNRLRSASRFFGEHHATLPLPVYVFPGLARRWQEIAPPALASLIHPEAIEEYAEAEGIIIDDYQLQTHQVHFTDHVQHGFTGTTRYLLRGPDASLPSREELTIRQQLILLAWFAFYTGVGYKPAMGMGQTRLV
jgi:hypothetical protein